MSSRSYCEFGCKRCRECGTIVDNDKLQCRCGCSWFYCYRCWMRTHFCKSCAIESECRYISVAIMTAIQIKKAITWLIAQYSMGYIINCSNNIKCDNKIYIDNKFEFTENKTKYFYYDLDDKYINQWNQDDMVNVYGKFRRFTCDLCKLCGSCSSCSIFNTKQLQVRQAWNKGDKIEIFIKKYQRWHLAQIYHTSNDDKVEWLQCIFTRSDDQKMYEHAKVPRYSNNARPVHFEYEDEIKSCKLKRCKQRNCGNIDAVLISGNCWNHAFCALCNDVTDGEVCLNCKQNVCRKCEYVEESLCKKCCVDKEISDISTVIFNAMYDSVSNEVDMRISNIISQYGMGYILNCSNKIKCNNFIIIDNRFEFEKNRYYEYCVDDKYAKQWSVNDVFFVYGAFRRFSCGFCKLNECDHCYNKDTVLKFDCCWDHSFCVYCNDVSLDDDDDDYIQYHHHHHIDFHAHINCINCKQFICWKCQCNSLCKKCFDDKEISDISEAIMKCKYISSDFPIDIIDSITNYTKGVVFECCTIYCDNDIITNSKYEFERLRIDEKINMYSPKWIASFKCDEMVYIYGDMMRLFCTQCVDINMIECEFCCRMETKSVCGDHKRCTECGYLLQALIECIKCNKYCCNQQSCHYDNICKTCIIEDEFNSIKKCLQSIIKKIEENIIDIIARYSMGIGVCCSNNHCFNKIEIITNNKLEYLYLNNKYKYNGDDINNNIKINSYTLYGKQMVIYCDECVYSLHFK